jgi:hypothetical protein
VRNKLRFHAASIVLLGTAPLQQRVVNAQPTRFDIRAPSSLQDKHIENQKFIKQVLEEHDKSKTGTLSFEEVRDWLSSIAQVSLFTLSGPR